VESDRRCRQYTTAHAHSMLHNQGYKHTIRISNTYCFSTATRTCTCIVRLDRNLSH